MNQCDPNTVRMGRTRKQAAKEGRRVLAIAVAVGIDDRHPYYSALEAAAIDFEAGGEWDVELMGPLSENITDAEYAARNLVEAAGERYEAMRKSRVRAALNGD